MKAKILLTKILMGLMDSILPNIKNSIIGKEYNPKKNKNEIQIDWIRLTSSAIAFIILVLNLLGFIDITEFIKAVIHELGNNIK